MSSRPEQEQSQPGTLIDIPSLPNLRDLGGYAVAGGGHVRTGRLYRSVELGDLTPEGTERFGQLGIRTVFDLRTEAERKAKPDRLPAQVNSIVCDILANASDAAPAQMAQVTENPALAAGLLGDGKAGELLKNAYRQMVSSPGALEAYRKFFDGIATVDNLPALFHCTTGKDRTGWAAAATLLLLGVAEERVFYDYELTNRDLLPAFQPLFERFEAAGGDPSILRPFLGVDPSYLQTALSEMNDRFGSIEGYFHDGLGIDDDGQGRLRAMLTVSDS